MTLTRIRFAAAALMVLKTSPGSHEARPPKMMTTSRVECDGIALNKGPTYVEWGQPYEGLVTQIGHQPAAKRRTYVKTLVA
jgi:hypothetical protein